MSPATSEHPITTLDRIAARAGGIATSAAVEPRLPTIFERGADPIRGDEPVEEIGMTPEPRQTAVPEGAMRSTRPTVPERTAPQERREGGTRSADPDLGALGPEKTLRLDPITVSPNDVSKRLVDAAENNPPRLRSDAPGTDATSSKEVTPSPMQTSALLQVAGEQATAPRGTVLPAVRELSSDGSRQMAVPPTPLTRSDLEPPHPLWLRPATPITRAEARLVTLPAVSAAEPTVEVTIGRVEIRAVSPTTIPTHRAPPNRPEGPSRLDHYLGRRSRGSRS
jgi:hypothetical protein